jgi:hypothetical protein
VKYFPKTNSVNGMGGVPSIFEQKIWQILHKLAAGKVFCGKSKFFSILVSILRNFSMLHPQEGFN